MTEYNEEQDNALAEEREPLEEFKLYVGRVPTKFDEEIVKRIIVDKLGGKTDKPIVQKVELIYPHDDQDDSDNNNNNNKGGYREDRLRDNKDDEKKDGEQAEHRGFGFVYFATSELMESALAFRTIKGGRKKTSKKLHTMYLRPYVAKVVDDGDQQQDGETDLGRNVCHLWSLHRCPYGDECKFRHVGEGGCITQDKDLSPEEQKQLKRKRKGKCFTYKKKGSCPKGDDCPFSHDFEQDTKKNKETDQKKDSNKNTTDKSQKDCINWKTKGKCRKGDKCEYKHDPELQKKALEKQAKKRGQREEGADESEGKKARKEKQPLSVRVFGLNYETTEADVKEFMESNAGHPVKSMVFPRFEDSGRSKGYCGVYFASPKAAKDAVDKCDGAELHSRWLRVQTGKSMTVDQWEGLHHK